MAITSNQLVKQVDLPVWEWTRPLPFATSTTGLSCTCVGDTIDFNENSGRYIYVLIDASNFWKYDTYTDTYIRLTSPGITPVTSTSMQFAGAQGYYNRVISATSNTIVTGMPSLSAIGYRIRILSGTGAGQERIITAVSEPTVFDWGGASAAGTTTLTDAAKTWSVNNWNGYMARIVGGTGLGSARKILYNTATVLTVADPAVLAYDANSMSMSNTAGTAGFGVALAAGSIYQIEASTVTVDTPWTVTPDSSSRFVIQAGGIWLLSGATVATGGVSLQYYSVLEDTWYAKPINNSAVPTLPTDLCFEKFLENSSLWYTGKASSGSTTTLVDSTAGWTTNQWAGYYAFIYTGTGRGQLGTITSNTSTTLTFSNTLTTAPDATSRYNIVGFDAGTLTASVGRIVSDSTKNWPLNRWANYAIRIVSGTGVGQIRQILSNGATDLVLYDNWNVQPDNTSIYVIQGYSDDLLISLGSNSETFLYRTNDLALISHGRILEEGVVQIAAALPTDGGSTATHVIVEQKPIAITSLAGTTTITATTSQPHLLRVGQWVSIRGVTSAAADMYNVTGKVQVATVPSTTTFTYTPFAAGSGTYAYSDGVAIGTAAFPDASKYHADLATGGSTSTVTFSRAAPSNINGWYAYGTNIAAGAQVQSGAGTTTLTLNLVGAGTPSGTIVFTKYPRPVSLGTPSGGGAGTFTLTSATTIPAYCKGWLVSATGTGIGAYLTGGEGTTTASVSIQNSAAASGTLILSHPTNLPLPVTATYSSGTGTSITLTGNVPSYVTGWFVSGTNIGNGATVVSGAGTATITMSNPTSGTPAGTITFYPPTNPVAMFYTITAASAVAATGLLSAGGFIQLVAQNTANGNLMVPIAALGTAPVSGVSKYVIAKRDMIGQLYAGQNLTYLSGVALGTQSTTTLVDTNSFWATATGSGGSAGTFTFTLSAIGSPIHNGWFVSGTGIPAGARVTGGAGTTTITIDTALTGAVSGAVTFTAWNTQGLVGRFLRVTTSTGANQELAITAVAPTTGTLTFATATAAASGTSTYSIMPTIRPGTGSQIKWTYGTSQAVNRGRNIYRFRGSTAIGVDRIDLTTDLFIMMASIPNFENFTTGSSYAYDGLDRIYVTKDNTGRMYYLDLNSSLIHGAGLIPYSTGTVGVGNIMEIFKTYDGLKYLWTNRRAFVETFRQLVFY
ncbi:hypothetical protein EBZ38_01615 [bacterium]|nr:hypothetical protein [bacterium]